jgi:murein DD-endopeptidase MepM/ murein hydrolase activator NlpD
MSHQRSRFFGLLTVVALLAGAAQPVSAQSGPAPGDVLVEYQPPVSGPIVDGWRPPSGPYGAGNRGIDYATTPGQAVAAPAAGSVSFAGSVAGHKWVVIRHLDGRRSSVGPLGSFTVRIGTTVTAGQVVGLAAGTALHWGVREADVYIDPSTLLPGPKGKLRLTK